MASLGDLERQVMDVLWDSAEPLSVRQVHSAVTGDRDLAYTTVMTVLVRLAGKDIVMRERDGRAWLYRPARSREEMAAEAMHTVLEDDGTDRSAALLAFVDRVTPEDADALRQALATLEQTSSARDRTRSRRRSS
ncbi:BlaI/MecI/CopY family transcriptional regulator [Propionibacteriaceae bacterium Y2011]|uniref:BlaI/MecI/CopY family transcriptional regulator n=1 Tax=Microlunatus sp. Y2014 TaxID=3418488 RepID=UPI003B465946